MEYAEDQEMEVVDDDSQTETADPVQMLQAIMASQNLAADLDDEMLADIATKVVDEYEIDEESRETWCEKMEKANNLAMLISEQKNYPIQNASNVKYPLLTVAALQFNARAYPSLIQGDKVVKCKTWGHDQDGKKAARAKRVSDWMSYTLLSRIPEWEEDTDTLTVILPIVGCVFRKTYYDPAIQRKCSRLVMASKLVVNYWARSMADAPRITEEMALYPYEIEERIRSGRFIEFDYHGSSDQNDEDDNKTSSEDPDAPQEFIEQHRLYDIDDDGYPEPYIVTVHKATQTVVRVVANFGEENVFLDSSNRVISIRRRDYYTRYVFFPSPDGGFYGLGLGWLLNDLGEAVNTTINQMLDAGKLANMQGGFVSASAGIREKVVRLQQGEWKVLQSNIPLQQAIFPVNYPGPNDTLFKLLGLLIEAAKEVSNTKDILSGENQSANQPATTTLALIEQGMQVFNSIFKRLHRSMKDELQLHADLDGKYTDPQEYSAFFDDMAEHPAMPQGGPQDAMMHGQPQMQPVMHDPRADFDMKDMDILPVTDPQVASRTQELGRAEFIRQWAANNPKANQDEAQKRYLEAAQIEDIDKLILPDPPPNPLQAEMIKQELINKKADSEEKRASIVLKLSQAIKALADAEGVEPGIQMGVYKQYLDTLKTEIGAIQKEAQLGQGRLGSMEGQPGNGMVPQNAPQGSPNGAGPPPPGPVPPTSGGVL